MDQDLAERVADVLKAVAHPARLQIVELLVPGEMCVSDIVKALGKKQAATSQHLNAMKDKGILASRRDGSKVYYRIENPSVIRLLDCVYDHCKRARKAGR